MVVKVLSGGLGGDLFNSTDNFGNDVDKITILNETSIFDNWLIVTYKLGDSIDTRYANINNNYQIYSGSGNDIVRGGGGNDTVYDGSGADIYKLGAGIDIVLAGSGRDTYDGGSGLFDSLNFSYKPFNQGTPVANFVGVKVDLQIVVRQDLGKIFGKDLILNFENVGGGGGKDKIYGNKYANQLSGENGNDYLSGRNGADFLNGGNGTDTLRGGNGKDVLQGGAGKDSLAGDSGADQFVLTDLSAAARDKVKYYKSSDSIASKTFVFDALKHDRILNFDSGPEATADRIDLTFMDGNIYTKTRNEAFKFITGDKFTANSAEVRLEVTGGNTIVHIDTDKDAATEMRLFVMGVTDLSKIDFIL